MNNVENYSSSPPPKPPRLSQNGLSTKQVANNESIFFDSSYNNKKYISPLFINFKYVIFFHLFYLFIYLIIGTFK